MSAQPSSPAPSGRRRIGGDSLFELHREMDRLFERYFGPAPGAGDEGSAEGSAEHRMAAPPVDVREGDDELCVVADLPGVMHHDLDVHLDGRTLILSGERRRGNVAAQPNYHVMERGHGRFVRSIHLPFAPDPEQVQARFDRGVLTIHMPRREGDSQGRRIHVASGGDVAEDPVFHSREAPREAGLAGSAGTAVDIPIDAAPAVQSETAATQPVSREAPPERVPDAREKHALHDAALARNWGFVLMRALVAVAFGVLAILWPGPTIASLILVFGVFMLVDGLFAVASGLRAAKRGERWGWFILQGLANIGLGAAALLWPGITVVAFMLLLAAWALVSGLLMLGAAIRLGKGRGRGWLLIGGLVSLAWAGLVVFSPEIGALALTLWVGAYALLFGVALLFFALRLRRTRRTPRAPGRDEPELAAGHA